MCFNNKSASFLDYRNHIYLFLKSLYKFLLFCHVGHVILAVSECALPYCSSSMDEYIVSE